LGNTKEGKENKPKIMKFVKPSLQTTAFSSKNLADLFKELKADEEAKKELLQLFKGLAENQEKVYKELKRGLESKEQVVIFDFSKVTEPRSRVNLAGLIMQELFNQNKQAKEERLLVLEEAHNFAPEVSYGDVSAGKENLALTMARKIASEGRKFKLGLLVITQRRAQVSKYVLSQANTQVMFRTMNSSDLDAIMSYVEFTRKDIVELLPSFQTGTAVVSGLGAPFPFVVNVK
jgi:DNA helicase HerA-like ATPase